MRPSSLGFDALPILNEAAIDQLGYVADPTQSLPPVLGPMDAKHHDGILRSDFSDVLRLGR